MRASSGAEDVPIDHDPIFYPSLRIKRWHVMAALCYLNGYRYGAEIGVSTGRFTMFLCAHMPEMKMIAVDLWEEQPKNDGKETYLAADGWNHSDSLEAFKSLCKEHFPGRIDIRRQHSVEAAKGVLNHSLDFVFIDADHSYEACLADIKAWTPKVKRGGMLAGHDFNSRWPGVMKAVSETGDYALTGKDAVWLRAIK